MPSNAIFLLRPPSFCFYPKFSRFFQLFNSLPLYFSEETLYNRSIQMNFLKGDFLYLMKHSSKPSVPGTSNETFPKTESTSSLQGSAESSSPDTSISNCGETHPSKIDALKNWFRTRPIVEKFCALPTYIQSWGLT